MTARSYITHRHKLVLFWSPKCGSRSLSDWFFNAFAGVPDVRNKGRWLEDNGFNVSYGAAARAVLKDGYFSAIAVRHPARRLASAFLDKFTRPGTLSRRSLAQVPEYVQAVIRDVLAHRGHAEPPADYDGISFNEFLSYLSRHAQNPQVLNAHWRPQFGDPYFARPVPFHHVLSLERFVQDLQALNERLGLEVPPVHANRGRAAGAEGVATAPAADLLDLPMGRLPSALPPAAALLTPATLQWMAEFYRRDYQVLGYEPFDPSSHHRLQPAPWTPGKRGAPGFRARLDALRERLRRRITGR